MLLQEHVASLMSVGVPDGWDEEMDMQEGARRPRRAKRTQQGKTKKETQGTWQKNQSIVDDDEQVDDDDGWSGTSSDRKKNPEEGPVWHSPNIHESPSTMRSPAGPS